MRLKNASAQGSIGADNFCLVPRKSNEKNSTTSGGIALLQERFPVSTNSQVLHTTSHPSAAGLSPPLQAPPQLHRLVLLPRTPRCTSSAGRLKIFLTFRCSQDILEPQNSQSSLSRSAAQGSWRVTSHRHHTRPLWGYRSLRDGSANFLSVALCPVRCNASRF
jgi:hypothetical protein